MRKVHAILFILAIGVTSLAHAQATRTWVSGVGDDANPCSRTAPCKTFAGAISKTAAAGIINVIDPGGFGAVTITKSITIDATPFMGGVLAAGTNGIVVNALSTDNVTLRGLDIEGVSGAISGVSILQAKSVSIENSQIFGYTNGVRLGNSSTSIQVHVHNCVIRNNTFGVLGASTAPGGALIDINESAIQNNSNSGVDVGVNTQLWMTRNVVANNLSGVTVEASSSSGALESNTIIGNANGLTVGTGGGAPTVRLTRNTITNNTAQGVSGSGVTRCFGTNLIENNSGGTTCTNANVAQQ